MDQPLIAWLPVAEAVNATGELTLLPFVGFETVTLTALLLGVLRFCLAAAVPPQPATDAIVSATKSRFNFSKTVLVMNRRPINSRSQRSAL